VTDDTTHTENDSKDEPVEGRKLPVAQVDWLLESLVAEANHSDKYAVPLTLLTSGGPVTGLLISMKEYFASGGDWWQKAAGR
jgi:hypothetical protein